MRIPLVALHHQRHAEVRAGVEREDPPKWYYDTLTFLIGEIVVASTPLIQGVTLRHYNTIYSSSVETFK